MLIFRLWLGILCLTLSCQASAAEWGVAYTGELLRNSQGGLATGQRYLDNLDLTFSHEFDSGRLPAVTFYGSVIYNNSNQFSAPLVGDLQVVSNIDNASMIRLYETWFEFGVGPGLVKTGLIDLNSEFDVIEPAGLFLNSSHGIGPDYSQSGPNGPSIFPVTSLGLRYFQAVDNWSVRVAVFDAVPGDLEDFHRNTIKLNKHEGALLAAEIDRQGDGLRTAIGAWYYTEAMPGFDQNTSDHNQGAYLFAEGVFDVFSGWIRVGVAEDDLNSLGSYLGAGLVWAPEGGRSDQLGLAVAHGRASSEFKRFSGTNLNPVASSETSLELTWRVELSRNFWLQPDVQYVINPGLSGQLDNALVFGLRFQWQLF